MFQQSLPEDMLVAGCQLHLGRAGSGPPLVYLHGCDGVSLCDPFMATLARDFAVTAISLPGFGDSTVPVGVRSVAELARIVARTMANAGIEKPVLVGSSFGGWVAAEVALLAASSISRLVLAAPMGARFTLRPDEVEIRDVFTIPTDDTPAWFMANPKAAQAAFAGMRFAEMPEAAAVRFCRNREALARFGWAPLLHDVTLARRLPDIDAPTLVLAGGEDRILAPGYAAEFARRIPGATYCEIPGAGHYVPLDAPQVFADRVAAFAALALTPA